MSGKKTRPTYTAEFKLRAIEKAETLGNRAAAKEIHVDESSIRLWRKNKAILGKMPKHQKVSRVFQPKWPELETKLAEWVRTCRADGLAVSTVRIRIQAKEMARQSNLSDFKGGKGWCSNFMRRQKFTVRSKTSVGQKLPDDWEGQMRSFHGYVHGIVKEKNIDPRNIYNFDEVPLTFDAPPNRTVDTIGVKSVYIRTTGNEKLHFTVVLACSATGLKLKPMLIFKRKTIPKENFPPGVIIKCNPKGWINEDVMVEWLEENLPECEQEVLLTLDSVGPHITDNVMGALFQLGTNLAVIPGGLTKKIQPLDLTINHVFKLGVRGRWERWMCEGMHTYTKSGYMRRATCAEVAEWVVSSWDAVKTTTIINAFRAAGIYPTIDPTVTVSDTAGNPTDEPVPSTSTEPSSSQATTSSSQPSVELEVNSESDLDSENDDELPEASVAILFELFHSDTEDSAFEGWDSEEELYEGVSKKEIQSYFCSDLDDSEFSGFE